MIMMKIVIRSKIGKGIIFFSGVWLCLGDKSFGQANEVCFLGLSNTLSGAMYLE